MGKILCFNYNQMADFEMTLPCDMLANLEEFEFITIGYETTPILATSRIQYLPQMTVKDALKLEDIEVLFIPGGFDRECKQEFIDLIQKVDKSGKLICAICAAPEFLAKSGILENHLYTTTLGTDYFEKNNIEDCFPRQNYVEEKVVRDKNLITAKGSSFIDFGVEILNYFNIFEDEDDKLECAKYYKGF